MTVYRKNLCLYRTDWDARGLNSYMLDREQRILVAQEVSRRNQENEKFRQSQKTEMDADRVERDTRNFNQSVSATTDQYIVDALKQVRKSSVTIPDELTRRNGTYLHNRSFKNSSENT